MVFVSPVTRSKGLGLGWLQLIEGTWDADSVTVGKVDLTAYISDVLMYGFNTLTGTGVTLDGMNLDTNMTTAAKGCISIGACTANDTGQFWAIGPKAV